MGCDRKALFFFSFFLLLNFAVPKCGWTLRLLHSSVYKDVSFQSKDRQVLPLCQGCMCLVSLRNRKISFISVAESHLMHFAGVWCVQRIMNLRKVEHWLSLCSVNFPFSQLCILYNLSYEWSISFSPFILFLIDALL